MGTRAQWVKPYIQTTIDSDFSQKLKNILNEDFNPAHPDAAWCSYINYIWTFKGFVYLTSVIDLYSGKIISWVLSEMLEASHVVEYIEKAKHVRKVKTIDFPLWQGMSICIRSISKATTGIILSYSKKAYSWDNACMESSHALLNREWIGSTDLNYLIIHIHIDWFWIHRNILQYRTHSQSLCIFVFN